MCAMGRGEPADLVCLSQSHENLGDDTAHIYIYLQSVLHEASGVIVHASVFPWPRIMQQPCQCQHIRSVAGHGDWHQVSGVLAGGQAHVPAQLRLRRGRRLRH